MAPVYNLKNTGNTAFAKPQNTTPASLGNLSIRAVGTQIGSTTHDFQHFGTMGRQVEHRGTNYIHFDWTRQDGITMGSGCGIGVESYNLSSCGLVYGGGGKFATVDYGEYCTIDADQSGCAIPGGNEGPDMATMIPRAYWDFCAGGPFGLFSSDYPSDVYGWYQNDGTGPDNANLWPVIEYHPGTENVLHMVTAEPGGGAGAPFTISYYRRVGPYGSGSGTWSAQRIIDTVMTINPTVTASSISDKVAIVWSPPVEYKRNTPEEYSNPYENGIWYATSNNQGMDWIAGIGSGSICHEVEMGSISGANITQYLPEDKWKAYCDLSALITTDDNLHIVWGCRRWADEFNIYRRQSAIFHWSEDVNFVRPVVKAEWDTGGACYAYAYGSDVGKMSISECDGKLYVLFTQFGNEDDPCFDYGATDKYLNGELYMSVSDDNGLSWDRAQNLTNSATPQCAAGDCESDYWASMSRFGRTEVCGPLLGQEVLDVVYINDRAAGSAILDGSGVWTTNPVMWFPTPCRDIVPEPLYSDNAGLGFGECVGGQPLVISPNDDTTIVLTLENDGYISNNFSISTNYMDGSGWIDVFPSSGTISSGFINTMDVDIIFTAPAGAPDPSVWNAEIQVAHDAFNSPRIIPVCMVVASEFTLPDSAIIATECKQLKLWNTGELGGNSPGLSLDFMDDCDSFNVNTNADIYLYSGSPVVSWVNGSDTMQFCAYGNDFTAADGFRPRGPWTIDEFTYPEYTYAAHEFMTADSSIGFTVKYFAPSDADKCDFIIQHLYIYNLTDTDIDGVRFGEFLDWDVPSDSGADNGSGFDVTRKLIYQYGAEYGQDDSTEAFCPQESDDRFAGIAITTLDMPKNAMTIDNSHLFFPDKPYGNDRPRLANVYELMGDDGYSTWSSSAPESLYTDLSTLVTFGEYAIRVGDTICATSVLATEKDGLSNFENSIDDALQFIADEDLECGGPNSCLDLPGDASNDGHVTIGDVVFLIHMFCYGGSAPDCPLEGDVNGDCQVDAQDVIYIVEYVFKGGPPPIACPCTDVTLDDQCNFNIDLSNSYTDPVFNVCPAGDSPFRVYLRNQVGMPVVGVTPVEIEFIGCDEIQPCPESGQEFTTLSPIGPSDEFGVQTFYMAGGGCDNDCYANVYVYDPYPVLLATVPVRSFDVDGDFGVSIKYDFVFSDCNDYNGNGYIDQHDPEIHSQHAGHTCDGIDPCDRFTSSLTFIPESNFHPGRIVDMYLDVSNNAYDSCSIGTIGFFYSEFGTGQEETFIGSYTIDTMLAAGQDVQIGPIEYLIPESGHGCVYSRFTSTCCASTVESHYCFQETQHCVVDSNVCYQIYIKLDSIPIMDTSWVVNTPEGGDWTVYQLHNPTIPLYAPDSVIFEICSPSMSSLGDSASVLFIPYYDANCLQNDNPFITRAVVTSQTGDANGDCTINVGDAVYIINYIFKEGPPPLPRDAGDPNCDDDVNVGDAVVIINYIFKGGSPPCYVGEE